MKKVFGIILVLFLLIVVIGGVSYGIKSDAVEDMNLAYEKEELYQIILEKRINYKDKRLINILSNWYEFFDMEDMFLTQDGEYIDFVTYEIYRVHLENRYKDDKEKIVKMLLKFGNYPKQENSEKYDEYINEYKKTTGKDI